MAVAHVEREVLFAVLPNLRHRALVLIPLLAHREQLPHCVAKPAAISVFQQAETASEHHRPFQTTKPIATGPCKVWIGLDATTHLCDP